MSQSVSDQSYGESCMPEVFAKFPAVEKFHFPLRASYALLTLCSPWGETSCSRSLQRLVSAINPRTLWRAGGIWVLLDVHHRSCQKKTPKAEQCLSPGSWFAESSGERRMWWEEAEGDTPTLVVIARHHQCGDRHLILRPAGLCCVF